MTTEEMIDHLQDLGYRVIHRGRNAQAMQPKYLNRALTSKERNRLGYYRRRAFSEGKPFSSFDWVAKHVDEDAPLL